MPPRRTEVALPAGCRMNEPTQLSGDGGGGHVQRVDAVSIPVRLPRLPAEDGVAPLPGAAERGRRTARGIPCLTPTAFRGLRRDGDPGPESDGDPGPESDGVPGAGPSDPGAVPGHRSPKANRKALPIIMAGVVVLILAVITALLTGSTPAKSSSGSAAGRGQGGHHSGIGIQVREGVQSEAVEGEGREGEGCDRADHHNGVADGDDSGGGGDSHRGDQSSHHRGADGSTCVVVSQTVPATHPSSSRKTIHHHHHHAHHRRRHHHRKQHH